jgi:glycosyltransferase involved in cell wall biosynthesis
MKTLLMAPELFAGGGGITRILRLYLKALCELAPEGGQVRFVSLNDMDADSGDLRRYSNDRLVEWRICRRKRMDFILTSIRMALKSDRIICGHVAQLPIAWAASWLRPGLKYILVAHGIEVWRPFTSLERRAIRGAHRVLCVSEYTRRQVLENCPIPEDRTAVLPNALDPYMDSEVPPSEAAGAPVILTVSRLSVSEGYKGIDHLIAAMPAILADIPGARLRIVGRGDQLPSLQALSHRLNVEGSVEFAGYRSDKELHSDFRECRLFALPSEKEGFGLVYIEAMAHGRPCMVARSGGAPGVITEQTGVSVEFGDIAGIAATAVAALSRNWAIKPIIERAQEFSYLRFKERLASLLSA